MTPTNPQHEDSNPSGREPAPSGRELDDLITRHFDGGLDPVEQRRLAALLGATPAARETLAGYLRLEGALIRLASAGLIGSSAGEESAVVPRPRSSIRMSRWLRPAGSPAGLVLAGSVLAAVVVAMLFMGRPESGRLRSGDVAFIAERWLELRATDGGAEPDEHESEGHDPAGDEADRMAGSPPDWLVAAVADEGAGRSGPDEG